MKCTTKIGGFLLAFLVLFSTFSFTVEKHFCGDYLVDVSFFGKANTCLDDPSIKNKCGNTAKFIKKSCCKDELKQIDGQNQLKIEEAQILETSSQKILLPLICVYHFLYVTHFYNKTTVFKSYKSQILVYAIYILHEVYRI